MSSTRWAACYSVALALAKGRNGKEAAKKIDVLSRVKTASKLTPNSEEVMPPCAYPRLTRIGCELCDSRDISIYQLAPFPESAVAENKRYFALRNVLDIF